MHIKLYYTPRTRATRVRWLLEELGQSYLLVPVELFNGEGNTEAYKKIHPLGCVPAIDIDGKVMIESGAICAWLTNQFPDKNMAPSINHPLRREYEQWMFFVPGTLEPPIWDYVLHKFLLPKKERIKTVPQWSLERYQRVLGVLHTELASSSYFVGDTFSTADILLGSTLMWKKDELTHYPNLVDYVKRLENRDSYIAALG